MTTHATIDIETIDTCPEATILSIGCVKFNPLDNSEPHSELYFKISIDDQDRLGRTASDDTIGWWSKQDPKIMEEALGDKDRISLDEMIKTINKWSVGVDVFWCQGPLFDYAILQNLYTQLGHPQPWQYWQIRDSRTLFSLVPRDPNEKRTGLHNALEDCYFQARKVQRVFRDLEIKNERY